MPPPAPPPPVACPAPVFDVMQTPETQVSKPEHDVQLAPLRPHVWFAEV